MRPSYSAKIACTSSCSAPIAASDASTRATSERISTLRAKASPTTSPAGTSTMRKVTAPAMTGSHRRGLRTVAACGPGTTPPASMYSIPDGWLLGHPHIVTHRWIRRPAAD